MIVVSINCFFFHKLLTVICTFIQQVFVEYLLCAIKAWEKTEDKIRQFLLSKIYK